MTAVFILIGEVILKVLHISLPALIIAGGIILLLVALDILREGHNEFSDEDTRTPDLPLDRQIRIGSGTLRIL